MIFFIHAADNSLVPLLFLKTVTYDVAMKIRSCLELDPLHIIHILGFINPNFLPISYDYGSFNNISGMDLDVSGYRKINV
jgi:hypothetical protein